MYKIEMMDSIPAVKTIEGGICFACDEVAAMHMLWADRTEYECPKCGFFGVSGTFMAVFDEIKIDEDREALRGIIKVAIRKVNLIPTNWIPVVIAAD